MTRRTLFKRLISAAAGTVLARMPFVGPKVEAARPQREIETYEVGIPLRSLKAERAFIGGCMEGHTRVVDAADNHYLAEARPSTWNPYADMIFQYEHYTLRHVMHPPDKFNSSFRSRSFFVLDGMSDEEFVGRACHREDLVGRMRSLYAKTKFRPPSPPGSIMNIVVRDVTS